MANMNMIIHDMEGEIEIGDTFKNPKFRKSGKLRTFDRVIANPMWLLREVERNEFRKKEQAEKGFDGLTFFVYRTLLDAKVTNAEAVSTKIKAAFVQYPGWKRSDAALRELRKKVTFAIYAEMDDLDTVTRLVDDLFTLLEKADQI